MSNVESIDLNEFHRLLDLMENVESHHAPSIEMHAGHLLGRGNVVMISTIVGDAVIYDQ